MELDLNNKEWQDALQIVNFTRRSLFLTGKAGTGKSTFLRYVVQNTKKKCVVLAPIQQYYERIAGGRERVALSYVSHCQRGPLLEVIRRDRWKDRAIGYSLHGVHRDDLEIMLDGHPMKREGSQGQQKTFVIALKLAQFELIRQTRRTTPLLLLDDIFDKLDAQRVEQIVNLVSGDDFGQIFITDTNREHLDQILATSAHDYKIFGVEDGEVSEKESQIKRASTENT